MSETPHPPELQRNPHFVRYYNTWQKNRSSIVFIPLAELYREQGLYEEAIEVCQRGLEAHPNSIGGRLTLARIYFEQERYVEAVTFVRQILSEMPGQREALSLVSRIENAMPPESNGSAETAAPPPPAPQAGQASLFETCTMAEVYAQQGETRTALRIIKNILARDPANGRARELEQKWSGS